MALKNIQLPELGEGVAEGELVTWLVKVGDKISADQAIAEMMTDKATVEVPSPTAGIVKEIKFKEGEIVSVGSTMIVIEADGAVTESPKPSHKPVDVAPTGKANAPVASVIAKSATQVVSSGMVKSTGGSSLDVVPPAADTKVLATPATRRLAREMGVDINHLQGSGLAGRVTREDVTAANEGSSGPSSGGMPGVALRGIPMRPLASGGEEERVPLKGIRKKIAENLQMAKQIVPHFTLADEANVTQLVKVREELKAVAEKSGLKVTYLPFVMKALIATMREFPMFNASIDDASQEIVYKKYFNIGFAADTPNGLLVPVVKDADRKTVAQISREIADLSSRARAGQLKSEEMKGATITITNIGSVGGLFATPIINHPEVAIMGMYKIYDKPVVKNGQLDVEKTMNFTITADHRLIDGAVAANFLKAFIGRIQNPGALMLDMI